MIFFLSAKRNLQKTAVAAHPGGRRGGPLREPQTLGLKIGVKGLKKIIIGDK